MEYHPPLDEGIRHCVEILVEGGIETYESCEGGEGHSYTEPTVRFHGEHSEGFRALAIALQHRLPVRVLHRVWTVQDAEPTGPTWELVFWDTESWRCHELKLNKNRVTTLGQGGH